MKMLAMIPILFCSCAAQTVLVPVPTEKGHKMIPIFRNSGDVAAIDYTYSSEFGSVTFYAREIDNSTATAAIHEGIRKEISAGVQPAIIAPVSAGVLGAIVP